MSKSIILVTGASSGFGLMTAKALAEAGHTVYASMRETTGRNAPQVADVAAWAAENKADLRTVELDVQSDASADAGIAQIISDAGRLDVIVHNAGHMVFGPAEAFTPEQLIQQYDVNVLGAQRVNRAALPYLRGQHKGLLVWVGSSSTRGGAPPFLGPYFAAKAAMDALAVTYSTELALWGIETTIMVPGAFTKGTNHFAHSGKPVDTARVAEYESGPYAGIADKALKGLAGLEPTDADPAEVARQIVRVVDMPFGRRPFRVHVDPSQDGAEIVSGVADRMRREMYRNIGLESLLHPAVTGCVGALPPSQAREGGPIAILAFARGSCEGRIYHSYLQPDPQGSGADDRRRRSKGGGAQRQRLYRGGRWRREPSRLCPDGRRPHLRREVRGSESRDRGVHRWRNGTGAFRTRSSVGDCDRRAVDKPESRNACCLRWPRYRRRRRREHPAGT